MSSIDEIVRDELDGLGIGLTKGTNLFGPDVSVGPGVSENGVFVMPGGGGAPTRAMGGDEVRFGLVNIRVRWRNFREGMDKAQEIIDNLQGRTPAGLRDVVSVSSEPRYIGQTEDGQHQWSLGFDVIRMKDAP